MGNFYVADLRTCEEFGMTMSKKQFYDLAGVPIREIFRILAEEQGKSPDLDAMAARCKVGTRCLTCPFCCFQSRLDRPACAVDRHLTSVTRARVVGRRAVCEGPRPEPPGPLADQRARRARRAAFLLTGYPGAQVLADELMEKGPDLIDPVVAIARDAKAKGVPVAVASSGVKPTVTGEARDALHPSKFNHRHADAPRRPAGCVV